MITDPLIQEATSALQQRTLTKLHALIEDLHPADLADLLRRLEEPHRLAFMLWLDETRAAAVLEALEPEEQISLVRTLTDEQVSGLLEEMAQDEAVDLLGELPAARAQRLLRLMGTEEAARIRELLQFPEGSAGALMTTELVTIPADLTVGQAIAEVRRRGQDAELLYYIYVTEAARLVGVVTLRKVIVAPPDAVVREIMQTKVITVNPWADRDEVARLVEKYDLLAVPVADAAGRLLGIVTADDILKVVKAEASEDVFALTAPLGEEPLVAGAFSWRAAWRRTFWLVVNFATALLTAVVIRAFTSVIETFLVLVFFMPVVMGTAGNVGTQSLAVAVRRFATDRQWQPQVRRALRWELATGLRLGAVCGTLLGLVVLVWWGDPRLAAVLWLAMVASLTVSAAGGLLIPLVLQRLRVDPAITSGPLVTTITDLASVTIYFTLALLLLRGGP